MSGLPLLNGDVQVPERVEALYCDLELRLQHPDHDLVCLNLLHNETAHIGQDYRSLVELEVSCLVGLQGIPGPQVVGGVDLNHLRVSELRGAITEPEASCYLVH